MARLSLIYNDSNVFSVDNSYVYNEISFPTSYQVFDVFGSAIEYETII